MNRVLALAILIFSAIPLATAQGAGPSRDIPIDEIDWSLAPEYRIVPGDELVLDFGPGQTSDAPLIRRVVVRPDGRISVYPMGDVVAAGYTPSELQAELIRELADELKQPRLVVEVTKFAGNQIHVLGRVKKPGSVGVTSLPTLLQVITEAGGFEDDAARGSVIVMHRVGLGSVSVARVRVDKLLKHGGDLPLSRYDIVYVPRSTIGRVDVFVNQFFERFLLPAESFALRGWELFNLDQVYQSYRSGAR